MIPRPGVETEALTIQVERGDTLAARLRIEPRVIKIDVEGAELDVVHGCEGLLRSGQVRELFIEVHPERLLGVRRTEHDVASFLAELGYDVVWRHARHADTQCLFRRKDAT
jgi:hypothetical protein